MITEGTFILLFLLSLALLGTLSKIDRTVQNSATLSASKVIHRSLLGLLVLGTSALVSSLAYFIFVLANCECPGALEGPSNGLILAGSLVLVLGIVITTLGGLILSHADGSDGKNLQTATKVVIGIGATMIVVPGGYFIYKLLQGNGKETAVWADVNSPTELDPATRRAAVDFIREKLRG